MLALVKLISTEIDRLNRRVATVLRFGKSDVQTCIQAGPYGMDSVPVADMVAIYGATQEKGKTVIIGYLNKNQLAAIGEHRIFSTDSNGALSTYIWLKNDGTMQIGGSAKNMVRFQELEAGFNQLKSDFNNLVSAYNSHTHIGVTTGGGSSGGTLSTGSASTASIADSKIEQIKTL